jgi:tyrosinase
MEKTSGPNRQRFLAVAGKSAVAAAVCQPLFAPQPALAAPFVRQDVGSLTGTSAAIQSYARAVTAMQALPATDPTSWAYQAAIHGTLSSAAHTSWNTCEHGTEWFWSWHRMYLYWFERIVRKKAGDPSFALPFWAWDSASERHLPPMFRDTTSSLYTANRDPNMNNGTGSLPAGAVSYAGAFATSVYSTSGGTGANDIFQNTPHGDVHVDVGGGMASILTAGLDPIFYLHHANCDRLWQVWRASYGGIDPTGDTTWTGKTYTFFNENGAPVTMNACQILNAAQQLNYTYQGGPTLPQESCRRLIVCCIPIWRLFPIFFPPCPPLGEAPVTVPVPINADVRQQLLTAAKSPGQSVYLKLEGVQAARQPGVVWEAFVGSAPALQSDENSPNYVGNVVLFGTGIRNVMPSMFRPATFAFKINRALLASLGNAKSLVVTFAPQGILIDGQPSHPKVQAPVQIGKMSIVVETPGTNAR